MIQISFSNGVDVENILNSTPKNCDKIIFLFVTDFRSLIFNKTVGRFIVMSLQFIVRIITTYKDL